MLPQYNFWRIIRARHMDFYIQLLYFSKSLLAEEVPTSSKNYEIRQSRGWCNSGYPLPGLDDPNCNKVFPNFFDREFVCQNDWDEKELSGFTSPQLDISKITILENELVKIMPAESNIALGIIRRYDNSKRYKIKWLGKSALEPYETWSSSKTFAGSRAGQKLRSLTNNFGGLNSKETGSSNFLLDDLLTRMLTNVARKFFVISHFF